MTMFLKKKIQFNNDKLHNFNHNFIIFNKKLVIDYLNR